MKLQNPNRDQESRPQSFDVCRKGHAFTPQNTVTNSEGFRECRTCRNEREKLRRRHPLNTPERLGAAIKAWSRSRDCAGRFTGPASASTNTTGESKHVADSGTAALGPKQSAYSKCCTREVSPFEREFLKLAATMLACTLEMQGGQIPGRKIYREQPPTGRHPDSQIKRREVQRRNLEYSALGLVDQCHEMRLLCREEAQGWAADQRDPRLHPLA